MNIQQILDNAPHGAQRYYSGPIGSEYLRRASDVVECYRNGEWLGYFHPEISEKEWDEAVTLESLRKAPSAARLHKVSEPPRSDEGVGKHDEVFEVPRDRSDAFDTIRNHDDHVLALVSDAPSDAERMDVANLLWLKHDPDTGKVSHLYVGDTQWSEFSQCGIGYQRWNDSVTIASLKSRAKRKVDWSKAPDDATHALTTGPKWCGPSDTIGKITFGRVNADGVIENSLGPFLISDDAWVVLETRPAVSQGNTVDQTVTERGERYGKFKDGSVIMQDLKNIMRDTPNWEGLTPSQREALEMIQHKIGRILNGDPMYDDNWRDICGYSQLVLDELNGTVR